MWEEAFTNLKFVILDQPSTIVHLYLIIQNAIMHIFDDEPLEIDIFRKKEKNDFSKNLDYFNFQINDTNFHIKTLDYNTIRLFRELISKPKLTETIELNKDSDSGSDDESDSGGDFDKIFNSFSDKDKSKKNQNN